MLRYFFLIISICFVCTGCTKRHLSYEKAMHQKIAQYSAFSKNHLMPAFQRAGVPYPPKQIALLVFKQSKQMQLYASYKGAWHFIKTFPVMAASGGPGPKTSQGDRQVPEGLYQISMLNPESQFLMSMKLNYPNDFDRQEAEEMHRNHLGGDIFIHGKARSIGCIAIGDAGIEELFPLVVMVGYKNVQVIIAPDDLRVKPPVFGAHHPSWLKALYGRIRQALHQFPLPRHS